MSNYKRKIKRKSNKQIIKFIEDMKLKNKREEYLKSILKNKLVRFNFLMENLLNKNIKNNIDEKELLSLIEYINKYYNINNINNKYKEVYNSFCKKYNLDNYAYYICNKCNKKYIKKGFYDKHIEKCKGE